MLVIAIMIGLVIGSLVLRGKPLPAAAATEGIENRSTGQSGTGGKDDGKDGKDSPGQFQ